MVHYSQSIEKDAIVTMFQQKIKLTLLKKHFGLFLVLSISQDVKTIRNGNYKCKNVIILRCYKNDCYHSITQLLFILITKTCSGGEVQYVTLLMCVYPSVHLDHQAIAIFQTRFRLKTDLNESYQYCHFHV